MKTLVPFFILLLLISGCSLNFGSSADTGLLGTWHLYDIEQLQKLSKDDDAFASTVELKKSVKDGEVLNFFDDGTYTDINGEGILKSGNWKSSDDNKVLRFIDSGKTSAPAKISIEKGPNNKPLLIFSNEQKNIVLKFVKEAGPLKEYSSDPFYGNNNLWRIKPAQPEDSAQLTKRLANYFKHLALILKSAKDRKQDVVSFEFSMGPAKIYNGGIGIHPFNIVPATWKNTYYNEADALKAYYQYQDYLHTSSYKGAGIGDWIEDDYNILLAIYSGISQPQLKNSK